MNYKYIPILSLLLAAGVDAKGLIFKPSISSSIVDSQTSSDFLDDRSSETFTIEPIIAVDYLGKRIKGQVSANNKHLFQRYNGETVTNNYTNYKYFGELVVIDRLLTLSLRGQQNYRNTRSSQNLVNDEYLGSDELSKTINNSITANFTLPRPGYVGLNINATVGNVKSDKRTVSQEKLNNTNTNVQAFLYQGDNFKRVNWSVLSTYRETNGSANNDLKSKLVDANMGIGLFSNWQLTLNAKDEQNERSSSTSNLSVGNLDYGSYGVGLAWRESAARIINISYNQASRSEDDKETFVGVDLDWQLSHRTSVSASYGRRFFGKSGSFQLSHNTKHLRTRLRYDENLTTFSRLVVNTQDAGIFVCPAGETSLSGCFQPTSPSYELQQGEQFLNLTIDVPDISEEVILRKSLSANIGFERRKVTTALDIRHTKTDYLDSGRDQTNNNIGLTSVYKAGPRTTFNVGVNYLLSDRKSEEIRDKTRSATLGITRQLGRDLSTSATFRYLDRQASESVRDLTDKRITLSLRYNF